jgi:lipoate---protein ligase
MLCTILETHDPFFNLALEEVLLRRIKHEYLILGTNDRSVVIGKHQAAHMEVDTKFVTENSIPVIRRISGGGTVFHDLGNLNFTFIRECETGKQVDFRKYTQPVIDFLVSSGIGAKLDGKSDIKIDGYKISGNAEHVHRNRVLHHGTLLFSSSLGMLKSSIRSDKSNYLTLAVGSHPAQVMNLSEKFDGFCDISKFSIEMMRYFSETMADFEAWNITRSDAEEAKTLAEAKYRSWEWNFAYGPEYVFKNAFLYDGKIHSCALSVRDGIVKECIIEGSAEMVSFSKKLTGCRHMVSDFLNVFQRENIDISEEEIFNFF